MSEMVERVAEAIFEANRGWAHHGSPFDSRLGEDFLERHRKMARAAIAAMRVTRDEAIACRDAVDPHGLEDVNATLCADIMNAVIDAALSEEKETA